MDQYNQDSFSDISEEDEPLDEPLHASDDQFSGSVLFIAANNYGLSAKTWNGQPMKEGERLINKRDHRDIFKIKRFEDNIITIESVTVPGLFLGLGPRSGDFGAKNPFNAVLVNPTSNEDRHKLRVVSAKTELNRFYVSFEPVSQPGYVLNHCNGNMYFSEVPNWPNEYVFAQDSSWRMHATETMEERVMRLPTILVTRSSSSAQECPICLEIWQGSNRIQVMTECGHTFCLQCMSRMSHMSMTASPCAMCRSPWRISELKRVINQT
mmetsp:Transcript_30831/g.61041  ORF Transcript_30831/g.61041 Transcript_30831/m.61041 type:complete len:267 (+) Transcript_30831:113-913(+)|eukprot:CAMPEP_0194326000 /NCGR_PEP_ID=MMETSP0171-20130528/34215_1 /TAXON_ID=218684 /ORGANISM="Corethron pennatum, Strain L29A3" /LENGTH=266 /DNA_ID=CAMNT_0039085411 /DNA_START=60 /DNA_END=860 /DNA_ORIENTATION=+